MPEEVQPEGGKRMPYDHSCAGCADESLLPAGAAYDVLRRVAEEGAYADRALRDRAEGLDHRDRAFARQLAFGSVQRMRTLDHAIETLGQAPGAQARPAGACGAAPRRVPARLPRGVAALRRGERVGRARAPRGARAGRAVHERGHAAGRRGDRAAPRRRCREEARSSTPIPDWIGDVWRARPRRGGGARADARPERAAAVVVRHVRGQSPDGAGNGHPGRATTSSASTSKLSPRAGSGRRAAARSSPGSSSARRRASAFSTSAPRRAERRRCSPATSWRSR